MNYSVKMGGFHTHVAVVSMMSALFRKSSAINVSKRGWGNASIRYHNRGTTPTTETERKRGVEVFFRGGGGVGGTNTGEKRY